MSRSLDVSRSLAFRSRFDRSADERRSALLGDVRERRRDGEEDVAAILFSSTSLSASDLSSSRDFERRRSRCSRDVDRSLSRR